MSPVNLGIRVIMINLASGSVEAVCRPKAEADKDRVRGKILFLRRERLFEPKGHLIILVLENILRNWFLWYIMRTKT